LLGEGALSPEHAIALRSLVADFLARHEPATDLAETVAALFEFPIAWEQFALDLDELKMSFPQAEDVPGPDH
jgi:hypothetical protein